MQYQQPIQSPIDGISKFASALRQNDLVSASHVLVNLNKGRDDLTGDLEERLSQLEGVYLTLVKAKLMNKAGAQ